jgi:pyruvate dehydrogenase E2 component (dihydrolipoamide acetyltransferase)
VPTEIKVPDIGDFKDVPVIEILVAVGDKVNVDDPLVSLESDKATMEVPASAAGVVEAILVKLGDKVSEGSPIVTVKSGDGGMAQPPSLAEQQEPAPSAPPPPAPAAPPPDGAPTVTATAAGGVADFSGVHASPSVRRLARELGIDLNQLKGTGEKGRVTQDDVRNHLKGPAAATSAGAPTSSGTGIPEIPEVDFSKLGPIETKPLSRIRRLSGPHLHRAWLNVPHVTHDDEADITDIEAYRRELDTAAKEKGFRVTLLAFLIKASVSALRAFPEFNASLAPTKDALIYKKFYNIGIAVDTPDGLVVPVIKDADRKGIHEISQEMGAISKKARDGKLGPADMSGGTFSISSLGGIGGTAFTPIVNAPEVAILGVVRSKMAPVWNGKEFEPRLMLPISLSYDHRVIDGALAARFARHLCSSLEDVRRLIL